MKDESFLSIKYVIERHFLMRTNKKPSAAATDDNLMLSALRKRKSSPKWLRKKLFIAYEKKIDNEIRIEREKEGGGKNVCKERDFVGICR